MNNRIRNNIGHQGLKTNSNMPPFIVFPHAILYHLVTEQSSTYYPANLFKHLVQQQQVEDK